MIRTGFFHSIQNRLIFLFSILFLIIVFLVITFFIYDSKNSGIANYGHQLQHIKFTVAQLDAVEKELIITRSDTLNKQGKSYEKLLAGYNHAVENLHGYLKSLSNDEIVQNNSVIQSQLSQILSDFDAHSKKADTLLNSTIKKELDYIKVKNDLQFSLKKIANLIEDLHVHVDSNTSKSSNSLRALFIFILFIALILNISLIIFVVFKLGEPLKELSKNIELIVKKNFARDIKLVNFSSKDEIANLASQFKVMLQRVNERTDEVMRQKQEVTNTLKNIKLLSKIGKEIISHLNIENLLRAVYTHLDKLMDTDVFSIGIFNEERKGLDLWSIFFGEDTIKEGFEEVGNETMLSVWCYTNQKEVFIQDYELEFRKYTSKMAKKSTKGESMYSIIYIPLSFKDEQIGIITVQSHNKYAYSEKHLNLLSNLAVYISIALENAYAYHRIEQQQNEISLKANDLHRAYEKLSLKNTQIVDQQKNITDSIYYAKRIQQAVLPTSEFVGKYFPEHFVYFKPRDIVSGDYYWMLKKVHNVIFAVADCTGHGVPGAFMSMLGVSFLNEIVHKNLKKFYDGTVQINDLLNQLKQKVIKSLRQTGKAGETKDGMDIGLCMINLETREMQYSGAYHPLILMRDNAIKQFKPDKMPVGYYINEKPSFTNHEYQLQPGDTLYMFSDGYIDQFGGEHGRKFMSKRFKELLLEIHEKPMKNQYDILDETLKNWMANKYKQVDDIMIMGIRIHE